MSYGYRTFIVTDSEGARGIGEPARMWCEPRGRNADGLAEVRITVWTNGDGAGRPPENVAIFTLDSRTASDFARSILTAIKEARR